MVVIKVVIVRLIGFKILCRENNPDQTLDETVFT